MGRNLASSEASYTRGPRPKTRPKLEDAVKTRKVSPDVLRMAEVRRELIGKRHAASREKGRTITCTFSLTPDVDQWVHDEALRLHCSRSAIVRRALLDARMFQR